MTKKMTTIKFAPNNNKDFFRALSGKAVTATAIGILGMGLCVGPVFAEAAKAPSQFKSAPASGQAAQGRPSIEDIRGSTSYAQLAQAFGIELSALYREAGVDAAKVPATSRINETAGLLGREHFETDEVRFAVSRLTGLHYEGEGEHDESTSRSRKRSDTPSVLQPSAMRSGAGLHTGEGAGTGTRLGNGSGAGAGGGKGAGTRLGNGFGAGGGKGRASGK